MTAAFTTINEQSERALFGADAVVTDGWAFVNGVLPVDLARDRTPLPESVEEQARKVWANARAVLEQAGFTIEHVVSIRVHLVDMGRFEARFSEAFKGLIAMERRPTRSLIGVSYLPRGALVSMDFVARK
jgi:2-iminobutanoate/2-iminopropanoate deaminase